MQGEPQTPGPATGVVVSDRPLRPFRTPWKRDARPEEQAGDCSAPSATIGTWVVVWQALGNWGRQSAAEGPFVQDEVHSVSWAPEMLAEG